MVEPYRWSEQRRRIKFAYLHPRWLSRNWMNVPVFTVHVLLLQRQNESHALSGRKNGFACRITHRLYVDCTRHSMSIFWWTTLCPPHSVLLFCWMLSRPDTWNCDLEVWKMWFTSRLYRKREVIFIDGVENKPKSWSSLNSVLWRLYII